MTWNLDIQGGDEVPNHPVPGTKRYTVDGQVGDSKNPPTELARVTNVEVTVNRNGVFVDKNDLRHQVSDEGLRKRFIIDVKRAIG